MINRDNVRDLIGKPVREVDRELRRRLMNPTIIPYDPRGQTQIIDVDDDEHDVIIFEEDGLARDVFGFDDWDEAQREMGW